MYLLNYVLFVLIITEKVCRASFDLYVDSKEFHKLLGVESELWYVRDGEVKENALGYVVHVPANINLLTFHWRARHNSMLPYKLETFVGNPEAVETFLNISSVGSVPTTLETFTLVINCTGKLTTQVDVSLLLQLPLHTSLQHLTNITIHRRKVCFRGSLTPGTPPVSAPHSPGASAAVYGAVGCLAAFLLLVTGLAAYSQRQARDKRRHGRGRCESGSLQLHASSTSPCLLNNTPHPPTYPAPPSLITGPSSQRLTAASGSQCSYPGGLQGCSSSYVDPPQGMQAEQGSQGTAYRRGSQDLQACRGLVGGSHPGESSLVAPCGGASPGRMTDRTPYTDARQGDVSSKLSRVPVAEEDDEGSLEVLECLLEGTFGRLHHGLYRQHPGQQPMEVVVKTVAEHSSAIQRELLVREAVMLVGGKQQQHHPNILTVLAVLSPHASVPRIVYRATHHGNMKRFLQGCGPLVTREVVSMGLQVLQALAFLHHSRLLHCDVATRNCVVDTSLHVLLGDCALSRDLFPGDYHCLGDNNNRPVKWLAIEALRHDQYSPHSDVWSWGVLLWEVMTLGQQPYAEIDPFEMDATLSQGVRLAQPISCPDEMFQAMTYCWTNSPQERPTVAELIEYLSNFLRHLDRFV